jgi:hypothetical protein
MFRRRKLSRDKYVPRSDGNTNASEAVFVEISRQALTSSARSGAKQPAVSPLGLRVIGKPSVDALSDHNLLRVNSPPTQSENLAGSHSDEDSQQKKSPSL